MKKTGAGIAVSGAIDAARAAASILLLIPGLSVTIDAIKESRKIFQRMLNYSIYLIVETFAHLGFLTLTLLLFKVYPVTAITVVLLTILKDVAILSIAYDNVHYSNKPETWNMRVVIGLASVIGSFCHDTIVWHFLSGRWHFPPQFRYSSYPGVSKPFNRRPLDGFYSLYLGQILGNQTSSGIIISSNWDTGNSHFHFRIRFLDDATGLEIRRYNLGLMPGDVPDIRPSETLSS